jgi:hypothetical protein
VQYVLRTDGTSDRLLTYPIDWLLRQYIGEEVVEGQWVVPDALDCKAKGLTEEMRAILNRYPCDLLFIHRDAEKQNPEFRYQEIADAMTEIGTKVPHICVVPVRMTEAWLLFDQNAIRHASKNPNGKVNLVLPPKKRWESLPDPKQILNELLLTAADLPARRHNGRRLSVWVQEMPEFITDYSPLRGLDAFDRLEADIRNFVTTHSEVREV